MRGRYLFSASSKVWESIDWVSGIRKAGFDGWEVVADGAYRFDRPEHVRRVRETLESLDIVATVHAPYSDLNLASLNHPIWSESVRQVCCCIEMSADFTDLVTFHPGYLSPLGKMLPEKAWEVQKEAILEIGRCAANAGVVACMENMGGPREFLCRSPDEMIGLAEGIEGIGFTFDLGHANIEGQVEEFLRRLEYATHLHLHDNHGTHDEHLAVGEGIIDWDHAGRVLGGCYKGAVVVEGRSLMDGERSLQRIRGWFA